MQITWTHPADASSWHALRAAAGGLPLIDAARSPLLQAAQQADFESGAMRELAADAAAGEATPAAADIRAALNQAAACVAPDGVDALVEELRLRGGPIREQWEARGPGLMRQLGRLTEPRPASRAMVALVAPIVGGHGEAFPERGVVTFEAVLANPHPDLPETLRLGWLLAQLDSPPAGAAGRLALAVATLAAGREVELADLDEPALAQAIAAWRIETAADAAAIASGWWEDYRRSPAPWLTAIADLAGRLP